jgi:LPXTG-motif cell wall-anchored protein
MKEPRYLFLLSTLICAVYLFKIFISEEEFGNVAWIALIGIFVSLGAWFLTKKKKL